ncbi:MAG TPA: SUMF1/EgtB/PvdO family nonheme iron enzyme, partial [Saprospiraceae bacterium]|nr:SUMF1/EgtB/PvdO family nonheme iron enzyme [Saprospiraceae bacterium]
MPEPLQIFIAYARKDASFLDELRTHLSPLEKSGKVKIWYDGKIEPGNVWEQAIKEHLNQSNILLLLVSADAIASDFFYEKEMNDALSRHASGAARVVPLIVRPCAWQATPLGDLQAVPKDGRAVSTWNDRDEAYADAISSIMVILESINKQRKEDTEQVRQLRKEAEWKQKAEETRLQKIADLQEQHKKSNGADKSPGPLKVAGGSVLVLLLLLVIGYWLYNREQNNPQYEEIVVEYGFEMVLVEGGAFTMGCDPSRDGECETCEFPAHEVKVPTFYMSRYEVTQSQWHAVMGSNPHEPGFKGCDNCPVESVSWNDVQDFLKNLNRLTGKKYRLPSEAEWEYAARGGKKSKGYQYSGSNRLKAVSGVGDNYRGKTRPVGSLQPNELGLYDMSGNVTEWCQDVWHDNYEGAPTDGSAWMSGGRQGDYVFRGGSWSSIGGYCRV